MVRYSTSVLVAWWSLACTATTPPTSTPVIAVSKPSKASAAESTEKDGVRLCGYSIGVNDQLFCVKKITAEQQRHRSWSQRLTYRDGRVVTTEAINGRGHPYSDGKDESCSVRENTYENGKPTGGWCKDIRGILRRHFEISPDGSTYHHLDAWKRPVASAGTRWVSLRREFDSTGRIVSHTYLDRKGRAVPNKDGVCRIDFVYDSSGAVLHERYYDDLGQPMLDTDGVHHVSSVPSTWGHSTEDRYFDTNDQPTPNRHGYHAMRFRYNEFGQSVEASRFGLADEPVIDTRIGASIWRTKRNEFGENVENYYYDVDGEPIINTWNYFFNRESYDSAGRRTERSFFDVDGEPTGAKGGNHAWRWNYDATGLLLGSDYLDASGQPILAPSYAGERFTHDERFNLLSSQTLGVDGNPVATWTRYATIVHRYDEFDQRVQSETFDAAGLLVDSHEGFAKATSRYAPDGSLIERRYFDARGGAVARVRLAVVRIGFTADARIAELPEEVRRSLERRHRVAVRTRSEARARAELAREALSRGRPAEVVIAHFGDRDKSGSPRASSYEVETLQKLPDPLREASLRLAESEVSGVLEGRDAFWVLRHDPDF